MTLAHQSHIRRRDRFRQRTSRSAVRDQHGLGGVQQFRRLRHEMHTGEDDDLCIHLHRFPSECQAVADDVGRTVKNLRRHVIMRQDHRVTFALQRQDRLDVVDENRPFDGWNQ